MKKKLILIIAFAILFAMATRLQIFALKENDASKDAVLTIDNVGITLNLKNCNSLSQEETQNEINKEEQGIIKTIGKKYYISDHAMQGFSAIKNIDSGTIATLVFSDGNKRKYEYCRQNNVTRKKNYTYQEHINGKKLIYVSNGTEQLVDPHGIPILQSRKYYQYDVVIATCNTEDGSELTATYWKEI